MAPTALALGCLAIASCRFGDASEDRVDLRSQQTVGLPASGGTPDVLRNQGGRGTCITFASTAALEAAYRRAGYGEHDFSEEFLNHTGKTFWLHPYWDTAFDADGDGVIADTNDNGVPDEGALGDKGPNYTENQVAAYSGGNGMGHVIDLANGRMAVDDASMPYRTGFGMLPTWNGPFWKVQTNVSGFDLDPENLPLAALEAAEYYSVRSYEVLCGLGSGRGCASVAPSEFEDALRSGHEIVFDFDLMGDRTTSIWQYHAEPFDLDGDGEIEDTTPEDENDAPDEGLVSRGGHSILLVGFDRTDPDNPYFIVKNSWGPTSGGVAGDCGEDGFTCISYDYLKYGYSAGYITAVNPPEAWPELAFVGRWDLSFDGHRGTLDIYHLPGVSQYYLDHDASGVVDRRIGIFQDQDGNTFRVNGSISGNRIDFYFDESEPNLRWDAISGRHFTFYRFSGEGDTMAGFYTEPDGTRLSGYARRSFDGSGFLSDQSAGQTFEPESFLGEWYLDLDGTPYDVQFREVSPWTTTSAGVEYAQILGRWSPEGAGDWTDVIGYVRLDDPARIDLTIDGASLYGKRTAFENELFAGSGSSRGFYALRESPFPSLTIVSPTEGSSYRRGAQRVDFSARVTAVDAAGITWTSDLDGEIGTGASFGRTDLSFGTHVITASVPDGAGGALTDTVTVTLTNDPPQIQITSPTSSDLSFCYGEMVDFVAVVTDLNDPPAYTLPDDAVTWEVSGGGMLGTGKSVSYAFYSPGTYDIVARATDELGLYDEATVQISVGPCTDYAPTVSITQPASDTGASNNDFVYDGYDQASGRWYKDVDLRGMATDPEDGDLSGASLVWTTNRTDVQSATLGTGKNITVRLYGDGCTGATHTITLTATDSSGNVRSTVRSITLWTLC